MFRWIIQSRSRHPLVRLLATVLGAIALVAVLAFGMFAAAALVIGGAFVLLFNALRAAPRAAGTVPPAPPPGVIEGEFTVVRDVRTERRSVR